MKKMLTLALASALSTGYSQTLLDSLQACYPLDCNEINYAPTGSFMVGTANVWTCENNRNGTANMAMGFNGTSGSHFIVPGNSLSKATTGVSISGWFYVSAPSGVSSLPAHQYLVFTKNNCGSYFEAYALSVVKSGSTLSFLGEKHGSPSNCALTPVVQSATITANTWYHLVFYVDNNNLKLYVNAGTPYTISNTVPLDFASGKDVILAGSNEPAYYGSFHGKMDNVRFYNRELSAADVSYLYNQDPDCNDATNVNGGGGGGNGDCCLGNTCGSTSNPLASDYEIPLNQHHFFFTDDSRLLNKVNVGYTCGNTGNGKLSVITNHETATITGQPTSISFHAKNTYNTGVPDASYGIFSEVENSNANGNGTNVGIFGRASTDGVGLVVGVKGFAEKAGASGLAYGGWFYSGERSNNKNFGVVGYAAHAGTTNIGVTGMAVSSGGNFPPNSYTLFYPTNCNVGVHGSCVNSPPNSSSGSPQQDWAGWFDGDVFISGVAYYAGFSPIASDRKFKREIQTIENASSIIAKLKPSNYFLNTDNDYGMHFSNKKQFGFISQEVAEVLPDLVTDVHKPAMVDGKGKEVKKAVDYKALDYIGFIALLTKGLQEQQKQLDEQKQLIAELSQKSGNATGVNNLNAVENGFQMSQNEPNPFTHETVVKYTLPQTINTAFMAVYDLTGKQVTTFPIRDKGTSSITITSQNLAAGIYIYSIVADGKVVDSKRMIVADK